MAKLRRTISFPGVFLVALVVRHCSSHNLHPKDTPHTSNQSRLCGMGKKSAISCDHQLHHEELLTSSLASPRCQMNAFVEASGCGSLEPSRIYSGEKPLVELCMYHYSTWMGNRATINFTFPSPDWTDLKLQYKFRGRRDPMCRQFSLHGVRLPIHDTLVFDCVVLDAAGETEWDADFTVVDNRGYGRTYTFRLPSQAKINPNSTSLENWHVFFYLHKDFIATSSHLPVTVQSYFHQVSYKVSMVKCLDSESTECGSYSILNSTLVHPKEDNWTVHLPIWSNPGGYAVTVQIVSPQCPPHTGCYVSVSPKFEIEPSLLGVWLTIGMVFFLISFLTFLLIFNHRLQTNKRILNALRESQPSVLLVYLPETHQHLEFISLFGEFLKKTCHLFPYLVDRDVGTQDPNCWTREHIIRADKVLFIVPGKPEAESITPIRNQWIIALNYLSGHHFTVHHVTHKVAVVLLPSSGNIPCEILHASRFKLVDEIGPLVTWLHNGTWLDEVFLWRPHIRSSKEEAAHLWPEVKNAAMRASYPTGLLTANQTSSVFHKNIFLTNTSGEGTALRDNESMHSEDSTATEHTSHSSGSVFDPDIPSFDRLLSEEKGSTSSIDDQFSDSGGDGIFT